mgnify:CR=1 FL=1
MTSAPVDIVTPSRWNQPLPRKIALLLLIGLAWEIYGRVLDNDLLFPTLLQTLRKDVHLPLGPREAEMAERIKHLSFGTWFEFIINQQGDKSRRKHAKS